MRASSELRIANREVSEDKINSYRDLKVWQEAMNLGELVYDLTRTFPKEETYGMTSQIRRSAISIASNIAEGHGRENTGSFIQFLRVAQGSLKELETQLQLSARVKIVSHEKINAHLNKSDDLGRMIRSLIRSLQTRQNRLG
jgi:four helix bundle protein